METLANQDKTVHDLIVKEKHRQRDKIRLIASENYASKAVLEATGSIFTNKYSEGYAGKRYYEGQEHIDALEQLAIDRAKSVFGVDHVNVQPYSGSPANLAIYFAFCKPGDKVLGLHLPSGGHLTHGWKVSITGSYFQAVHYHVDKDSHRIDMDEVRKLAIEHKPRILWAGGTAVPRTIDFEAFGSIAKETGAILVADIAHISGLIAGGAHPSPVPYADVISTTTHKTLRGPRGGMIMCKAEHAKAIDKAVFPGLQGGPHNHTTAALAVALGEAQTPAFKDYAHQIVKNAKALAEALKSHGLDLVSGGTDNHLVLVDLTSKNVPGKMAAKAMDKAGIVANYNTVPFDKRKPFDPSGLRLGTPAVTSRGMKEKEMTQIADWMHQAIVANDKPDALASIANQVKKFCADFPAPGCE